MNASALVEAAESVRGANPDEALRLLQSSFSTASRSASPSERALLWRTRAHVLRALRRTREAAAAYARSAQLYAGEGERREEGRCAIGAVDALMYLGRYDEARRVAARGRRLLQAARDRGALARLLNNEGNLWHRLDRPERALAAYRAAERTLRRMGEPGSADAVSTNVGNCLSLLGRCDEARAHYLRAAEAHAARNATHAELRALYNLAYLDFLEIRHEAALASLAAVRGRAVAASLPSIAALSSLDRAEVLLHLAAPEEAREESERAIAELSALGLRYETGKARLFAALASHRSGRDHAARAGIELALAVFTAEGNAVCTTMCWGAHDARAAAVLLSAAGRQFAAAHDRDRTAEALLLEARALIAAGSSGAAKDRLRRASEVKADSARLLYQRRITEAALARAEGRIADARRALRAAARASEQFAARILDEHRRASFWGEWGWPHRELAALELDAGDAEAAFEALEAGRGRTLIGERHRSRLSLPASVRRWAASRVARDRRRGSEPGLPDSARDAVGTPLARALVARESVDVKASDVRRMLGPDELLLDAIEHDGRIGLLAITRERASGCRAAAKVSDVLQHEHALLFALRRMAMATSGSDDSAARAALAALASALVWPHWEPRFDSLSVAPTRSLARLPWASLPLPDGRPLCASAAITVVPGLRLVRGSWQRPTPLAAGAQPLLVAAPGSDLAAVEPEIECIASLFPGAQVLRGTEATASRFLALAPSASWIHFAGHGAFIAAQPQASGLRFADRWLPAGEIAEASIAAQWVTLSACHTARALVHPGEEWFGLTRALLLSGARAVVAAQWDIDDRATARFMTTLYGRLAAGVPLARALAATQAVEAASGAPLHDWAGFTLLGAPGMTLGAGERPSAGRQPRPGPRRSPLAGPAGSEATLMGALGGAR